MNKTSPAINRSSAALVKDALDALSTALRNEDRVHSFANRTYANIFGGAPRAAIFGRYEPSTWANIFYCLAGEITFPTGGEQTWIEYIYAASWAPLVLIIMGALVAITVLGVLWFDRPICGQRALGAPLLGCVALGHMLLWFGTGLALMLGARSYESLITAFRSVPADFVMISAASSILQDRVRNTFSQISNLQATCSGEIALVNTPCKSVQMAVLPILELALRALDSIVSTSEKLGESCTRMASQVGSIDNFALATYLPSMLLTALIFIFAAAAALAAGNCGENARGCIILFTTRTGAVPLVLLVLYITFVSATFLGSGIMLGTFCQDPDLNTLAIASEHSSASHAGVLDFATYYIAGEGDGKIRWKEFNDMCLDGGDGTRLRLWRCVEDDINQQWTVDPTSGKIIWRANPSKCLHLPSVQVENGVVPILYQCMADSKSQMWEVKSEKIVWKSNPYFCFSTTGKDEQAERPVMWQCDTINTQNHLWLVTPTLKNPFEEPLYQLTNNVAPLSDPLLLGLLNTLGVPCTGVQRADNHGLVGAWKEYIGAITSMLNTEKFDMRYEATVTDGLCGSLLASLGWLLLSQVSIALICLPAVSILARDIALAYEDPKRFLVVDCEEGGSDTGDDVVEQALSPRRSVAGVEQGSNVRKDPSTPMFGSTNSDRW